MRKHIKIALEILLAIGATVLLIVAFFLDLDHNIRELREDTPAEGIARAVQYESAPACAAEETESRGTLLRVFCETDEDLPAWWSPETAEIVYQEPIEQTTHSDALDYNLNTTLWGWDGHGMEVWELSLFSMIFYREFWQPNLTLCEAGCDAMLRLWERDGGTMFETLSRINEDGSYAFSTYPGVWETEYDPDGLAWCKEFCEKRFYEGPVWSAQYFRKGQYHDWGEWSPIPAYEIDGIYFSMQY